MRTVFFTTNSSRKSKFRIETRIEMVDGQLRVEKKAATDKARDHVNKMATTFNKYANSANGLHFVKPIARSSDTIVFPFVQGHSLEKTIFEHLHNKNFDEIIKTLKSVKEIFEKWESYIPGDTELKNFRQVFGDQYPTDKSIFTPIGLIDFNLDNFIIDQDGAQWVIDYEWDFDFPLPKNLFFDRIVLWTFLLRARDATSYIATDNPSHIEIARDSFVPQKIYDAFRESFDRLGVTLEAEKRFQEYVTGYRGFSDIEIIQPTKHEKPKKIGFSAILQAAKDASFFKDSLDNKTNEVVALKQYAARLNEEIKDLKSSRLYKLSRSLRKRTRARGPRGQR